MKNTLLSFIFLNLIFFTNYKIIAQPIGLKWTEKMNMYEVNVRQYTAEGTFKAFQEYLPRLKNMGIKVLWFMPINPISNRDRKGSLGSYYAISNYKDINPEFGRMPDWIALVHEAHTQGFKVLMDWVPSHTGADHSWLYQHKNFYVLDKTGNPTYLYDWKDTRKLNYQNKVMRDSMIEAMKFWVKNTDIDGFRVDVAGEVPDDFWRTAIPEINKIKPLYWLAEADKPSLHEAGFHATYSWREFQFMKKIVEHKNKKYNAKNFYKLLVSINKEFPNYYNRLYFTSNHDENSWNGADFNTMPGSSHAPFALLTATLPNGYPLIYSGQEIPIKRAIKFFDKDQIFSNPNIEYDQLKRFYFYQTLLNIREDSSLTNGNQFLNLKVKNKNILAFIRSYNSYNLLVIVNLNEKDQKFKLKYNFNSLYLYDVFKDKTLKIDNEFEINGWGYKVYKF
ncbi:MAG: alpha-amylase family glycosyl hydrolase [Alphaproteobacteria bacterium]|nr:alpha-amylase family glycosyl hydrolase [Alphaproteobacteria bacterium]